jgi:hypothetical protein
MLPQNKLCTTALVGDNFAAAPKLARAKPNEFGDFRLLRRKRRPAPVEKGGFFVD